MTGLELILFSLSSLGLINILVYSPIMEGFRNLVSKIFTKFGLEDMGNYFVKCPVCIGFWVGILMMVVYFAGLLWFTLPFTVSFLAQVCLVYLFPE